MGSMAAQISLGFLSALLACLPLIAQAHSFGSFYEETVGPYLVDIGYDPPEPLEGGRLLLDLNLFEAGDKTAPVEFSSAWVRLEHNGSLLFAGPIAKLPLGPTTVVTRMPQEPGALVVHARFERGSAVLGEVSFPLAVLEAPGGWELWHGLLAAVGALLVLAGAVAWGRRARSPA
jgi:hypothetical protein